ncbi:MAG: hypothetical protein NZL85_06520 [Fimbriimonadales bacterium]|nr:hypothetical protein [Fimbriimonadales bacterium]
MRRRECDRISEQMEAWGHDLPEWVKVHLHQCAACAEEWQREQRYRRVLQTVRQEPIPTSQLRWEHVQMRLAARSVQQRTLRWRFAFGGAFASVFALCMLGVFGFFYLGDFGVPRWKEAASGAQTLGIESQPPAVLKKPDSGDAVAPDAVLSEANGKHASASAGEPKSLAMAAPPSQRPRDASAAAGALPAAPSPSAGSMHDPRREQSELYAAKGSGEAVAMPLPDLRPETAGDADYLPIQYSGSEESHVYSF